MSALGALRRVMKLKIKKKSTAKPTTTKKAATPKTPMDQPGSEKIKEAYLVMKHVQSMTMGDKLKISLLQSWATWESLQKRSVP